MSEWGNNPASWEAIASVVAACGILAVFLSTFFAWKALREARAQRTAIECEMAARLRPWVGLFNVAFKPGEDGHGKEVLRIFLRNLGTLPAQGAKLQFEMSPLVLRDGEPDNAIRRPEYGGKTVLPGEDANYTIELYRYHQFKEWRSDRRDLRVTGKMEYSLTDNTFATDFEIKILFSQSGPENDGAVPIRWRNVTAI